MTVPQRKRVFIVHGWDGSPENNWMSWLGLRLQDKGVEAHVLHMPNAADPKMGEWVAFLANAVVNPDANTYLVGHSLGCQTILRYLESLGEGEIIGGALLVAGFFTIKKEVMFGDASRVLGPWVNSKIDLSAARSHAKRFVLMLSDNDPYIPLSDSEIFRRELGSKIIIMPGAGHFSASEGYRELHAALNECLKMM